MRRAAFILVLIGSAAAASAEPWRCDMTVACPADAPCDASDLTLDLLAADHAGELFLTGLGQDIPVAALSPDGAARHHYAGHGANAAALLLSIEADSRAVLTLHSTGPTGAATSYFGTCEELT
ncbi:hypothetical protein roselon_02992 [Roseibacterium elongatum DSM 19469]|uniref:Uncharacterized protein n=1 Tax=Roseicyclus elongatus DSM 19469 TaxID=1294273 RepID=W8RVG1_9RHOB|nr:hypothetical protein [Roseibacterium elongatum]AHM05273.1 hypothetical protein roselon_02992 [Roseibacterium elongatum DSM 19469]